MQVILGKDWGSENPDVIKKYLRLLWRFQIACEIDDHRILVPPKLPAKAPNPAPIVGMNRLLTRYYFFSCIPYGFWARFISRFLLITKEMLSPNPNNKVKPEISVVKNNGQSYDELDSGVSYDKLDEQPPKINVMNISSMLFVASTPKAESCQNQVHPSPLISEIVVQCSDKTDEPRINASSVDNFVIRCFPVRCFPNNSDTSNESFTNSHSDISISSATSAELSGLKGDKRINATDNLDQTRTSYSSNRETSEDSSDETANSKRFSLRSNNLTEFDENALSNFQSEIENKLPELQDGVSHQLKGNANEGINILAYDEVNKGCQVHQNGIENVNPTNLATMENEGINILAVKNEAVQEFVKDSKRYEIINIQSNSDEGKQELSAGHVTNTQDCDISQICNEHCEESNEFSQISVMQNLELSCEEDKNNHSISVPIIDDQEVLQSNSNDNVSKKVDNNNIKQVDDNNIKHESDKFDAYKSDFNKNHISEDVNRQSNEYAAQVSVDNVTKDRDEESFTKINPENNLKQSDDETDGFMNNFNFSSHVISAQDYDNNQNREADDIEAQLIDELSNDDEIYEENFKDSGELAYLLDNNYLTCWDKGIIFNHPQLYFSVQQLPVSVKPDRETIEIRVSKSPLGYRVLSYVVDHIRTLLREWYEGLLMPGKEPQVVSCLACPVCTSLCIYPPSLFNISTAFEKIYKVSEDNTCKVLCERNHVPRTVNITEFCPDLTFQDLPKTMRFTNNDIQCEQTEINKLGEGQFGKVFRGLCKNKIKAAIKFYKFDMNSADELSSSLDKFYEIRQEIIMLSKLRHHPYIIQFLGFSLQPDLCAVIEYAQHGALSSIIHKKPKVIPRIVRFRICQQIASAVAFMHQKYILHRDIKSDNILLFSLEHDAIKNIKLTDFGTANFMSPCGMNTFFGTKGYAAPEMILYKSSLDEYTSSVDIYSFGIVLYELICYRRPFHEVVEMYEIDHNVKSGFRPKFYDISYASYGLVNLTRLMTSMWHQESSKRPSAKDVLNLLLSPIFQLVFGIKKLPPTHNPRELCYISSTNELWIACDDKKGKYRLGIKRGFSNKVRW